jgi:hypothetical protein
VTKHLALVLAILLIVAPACSSLPGDEPGSIAVVPFSLPDIGIQGMVPSACPQVAANVFGCEALPPGEALVAMVINAHALAPAEIEGALLDSLGVAVLPDPLGSYRGRAFAWQRYQLDSELKDQGLPPSDAGAYRVDLALAGSDGRTLLVAMITLPVDREAHPAFYDALFKQVLYTLAPLPSEAAPRQEGSSHG